MTSKIRPKILVVEDKENHNTIICDVLLLQGYEVIGKRNADEAIHMLLQDRNISLMILDQMMPGMSGVQLYKRIHSNPALSHARNIPVIFSTANAEDEEFKSIGTDKVRILQKPFRDVEDIIDMVKKTLNLE